MLITLSYGQSFLCGFICGYGLRRNQRIMYVFDGVYGKLFCLGTGIASICRLPE